MNSQITDELLETLRGIKEGKNWEYFANDQWKAPITAGVWDCLVTNHKIRLKPFVPEPPEGYRLLLEDECDGRFIPGAKYWHGMSKDWKQIADAEANFLGSCAVDFLPIAVPVTPPEPQYVPLGPKDVPPGSVVRCLRDQPDVLWWQVKQVSSEGIILNNDILTWRCLVDHGFEILRPGSSEWVKCEKIKPCGTLKQ